MTKKPRYPCASTILPEAAGRWPTTRTGASGVLHRHRAKASTPTRTACKKGCRRLRWMPSPGRTPRRYARSKLVEREAHPGPYSERTSVTALQAQHHLVRFPPRITLGLRTRGGLRPARPAHWSTLHPRARLSILPTWATYGERRALPQYGHLVQTLHRSGTSVHLVRHHPQILHLHSNTPLSP